MYYDLCLNHDFSFQNLEKFQIISELITSAICDGYRILALNINKKGVVNSNDIVKDLNFNIKNIFNSYSIKFLNSSSKNFDFFNFDDIKILKRITIEINESKELYQFSNPTPSLKSYDIVAIIPKNEKIFELACNDVNVDIITISFDEKMNFFLKKSLIQSAVAKNIFFEIIYNGLIIDNSKRAIFISNVLMLLEITKGKNLIISSGADNFIDHRSPYDIVTM
jgi:RNase P/RNase MRP subunit p30